MVCPVCDAEVYDHDVETCLECETPLATWVESYPEYYPRPLVRCSRCGECPRPGDRTCRQCQAHFLKRAPAWLDAIFPGWMESDEWDLDPAFSCTSCDMKVALDRAQCETCGLQFYRPTEHSLVAYEPGIGEVTVGLEADEEEAAVVPYTHDELAAIIVSRAKAIFGIDIDPKIGAGLAQISQGTAANAINLLKTVVRMAQAETKPPLTGAEITPALVATSLKRMGRDPWVGLDRSQRKYLVALAGEGGRGLSAANLATMSNEQVSTIETMLEPFLLQRISLPVYDSEDGMWHRYDGALVERTKSGRCPTALTYAYLEMARQKQDDDPDWFAGETLSSNNTHTTVRDAKQENSSAPAAVTPPCTVPLASVTYQPSVSPVRDPAHKTRSGEGITAAVIAALVIPPRARLLNERHTSYKALIASGKIRPVPSVKWLSGQSVICAQGHQSNFGLFACLPGYGTLDNLPENDSRSHNWLGSTLHRRGEMALHNINDRDPRHDVRWQLGCPTCGTDLYTFEAEALREYVMCTTSPDLFWVFCHLYRRDLGGCGNCGIRGVYWNALRLLE